MVVLCHRCHKDYVDAGSATPEALSVLYRLELIITPIRKALEGETLVIIVEALRYFEINDKWLEERLSDYQDWDRRFGFGTKYDTLDRPGYRFIKIVKKIFPLINAIDEAYEYEDVKRAVEDIRKANKEHLTLEREFRATKEITGFRCTNHEYFALSPEDRREAMTVGKSIDSSSGRVTSKLLLHTMHKHTARLIQQKDSLGFIHTKLGSQIDGFSMGRHHFAKDDGDPIRPKKLNRSRSTLHRSKTPKDTSTSNTREASTLLLESTGHESQLTKVPKPLLRAQSLLLTPNLVASGRA